MDKTLKTEIVAGFTTFLTMSYIIAVNPSILATEGTGISFSGVLTATILVSFLASLLMGLYAKLPFSLAPGMGLNAFFTFSLILGEGIPWPQALGLVFWSGVFFIVISVTPLREKIALCIPHHLRLALAAGIGLFLTFIGLKNAGFVTANPVTLVQQGHISIEMLLAFVGILVITFLFNKKNPASFLIGIVVVTLGALVLGKAQWPESLFAAPDFSSVFFKVDFIGSLQWAFIPAIITLVVTDLFDSLSTFIGVSESSGLLDEKGEPKNIKQALLVDAFATFASSLFGTSPATTYIESSAGTEVGGRTGMTAMVTAACFLPFLFLSPLIGIIPVYATAPVLIFVGVLMFRNVAKIDFKSIEKGLPSFLTLILIPLTFSITHGILWGFISHVLVYLMLGKAKQLHPMMIGLGVMSVVMLMI